MTPWLDALNDAWNELAQIEPVARQYRTRLISTNVSLDILAGMLGHVSLVTEGSEAALLLPKDALVLGGPQPRVMVIDAKPGDGKATPATDGMLTGQARSVAVTLGVTRGSLIQVQGDIHPDDRVVTRGNERLRDGQWVTWKELSGK